MSDDKYKGVESEHTLRVWYHNFNVMTETPHTEVVEKKVTLNLPQDFDSRLMRAAIEGKLLDDEFNRDLNGWNNSIRSQVNEQMKTMNLEKLYQRVYVELSTDLYYIVKDNFRVGKSNFVSSSEINQL